MFMKFGILIASLSFLLTSCEAFLAGVAVGGVAGGLGGYYVCKEGITVKIEKKQGQKEEVKEK